VQNVKVTIERQLTGPFCQYWYQFCSQKHNANNIQQYAEHLYTMISVESGQELKPTTAKKTKTKKEHNNENSIKFKLSLIRSARR
jgi:hypothetical protein